MRQCQKEGSTFCVRMTASYGMTSVLIWSHSRTDGWAVTVNTATPTPPSSLTCQSTTILQSKSSLRFSLILSFILSFSLSLSLSLSCSKSSKEFERKMENYKRRLSRAQNQKTLKKLRYRMLMEHITILLCLFISFKK